MQSQTRILCSGFVLATNIMFDLSLSSAMLPPGGRVYFESNRLMRSTMLVRISASSIMDVRKAEGWMNSVRMPCLQN